MADKVKKAKREKKAEKKAERKAEKKARAEKKPPVDKRKRRKKVRRRRRRIACLVLLLIVIGVMVLHARLPGIIVGALESELGVLAEVGDASFSWPDSIIIKDLTVRRKADGSELGSVGRARVQCRFLDLLTASIRPASADVDDVRLSLREGDRGLVRSGEGGGVPDFPLRIRRLSIDYTRAKDAGRKLSVGGVAVVLEPRASGCTSIEGSGASSPMGPFYLSGILGGDVLDSRVRMSFPRVRLNTDARDLLPPGAARAFAKLNPTGGGALTADLTVPRDKTKRASGANLTWRMALKGVSFKLPQLSEHVTDVNAIVEGTVENFTLTDLAVTDATGNYQSTLLSSRIHSLPASKSFGLRISVTAKDIRPTADVMNLLPPKIRAVVERFHMADGRIDLVLEMRLPTLERQADGRPPKADFVRADVTLRDCVAKPEWFPYRLNRIVGKFSVGMEELVITSPIVGWHGGGSVSMTGTIGVKKEGAQSEIVVVMRDLDVDSELESAIAGMGAKTIKAWRRYSLKGGTIDADLNIRGSLKRGAKLDWAMRLSLDGCSGSYDGFPYALTGLTGSVDVRPKRVLVKNLAGWHGDTTVRVTGWVDAADERRSMRLQVRGTDVNLDDDLANALPADARKAWDRFRPAGVADVNVVLSTPTKAGVACDVRVSASLKGCNARVPVSGKWVSVEDVSGRLEIFGDVVRLAGLKLKCLGGSAAIDATIVRAAGLMKLAGDLTGEGLSAAELIGLLPADAAEGAQFLAPSGKVSVDKLSFDVIDRDGRKADVAYECRGRLADARIAIPMAGVSGKEAAGSQLALSEINGRFNIENERGRAVAGAFELEQVRLLHGTMRNVVGRIRKTGPIFVLEDVRGEMYGGRVEASFKGAADLLFFSTRVRVIGMDIARLATETDLTKERVWGNLEGGVQLNGERIVRRGKDALWHLGGSGSFRIDRANLGRTPLVKSVLSYKGLFGAEPIITDAKVAFEIDSSQLKIHKMILRGESGATRAVGTIDYDNDMAVDLYFYRKRKGSLLPNLPVVDLIGKGLNWVVEKAWNGLVVIHVTGTLAEPNISPVMTKDVKDVGEQVWRHIIFNVWKQEEEGAASGADD